MIVFAYAPWCGHCKTFKPIWDKVRNKYRGKIKIAEVDCEANPEAPKKLGVKGFPTVFFIHGDSKHEFDGVRDEKSLDAFFKAAMMVEKKKKR